MFGPSWVSSRLLTPICCAALLGCTVVDQYSGRAIVYNLEAEQAQDQEILLNIVRAYLRRPMQFTTVSTITGIASVSGGAQYTLPTNVPFRPAVQGATGIAAFPPLPTWQLSGAMSGGPAFTVPVLDTQEFYQGILKAIPGQIWDLYIQAGYPPDLLFNLFIEKVVMHVADLNCTKSGVASDCKCPNNNHTVACEFVFQNYVLTDIQIDLFQALADYLLALGLTTERPDPQTVPLDRYTTNINLRYVGALSADKKSVQVTAPPGGSASPEPAQPRPYKLCFAPRDPNDAALVFSKCGKKPVSNDRISKQQAASEDQMPSIDNEIGASGAASVNLIASREFIKRLVGISVDDANDRPDIKELKKLPEELAHFDGKRVTITIYMRHTQGMIYYLGEVVRRANDSEFFYGKRAIFAKEGPPYRRQSQTRCTEPMDGCGYIFRLHEDIAPFPGSFATVNYSGQWYSVGGKVEGETDLSSLTFEFIKQQIALNSSAKSLPQSSVVTTVGGQ
jgi:hypothetical protein